jgi:hypothetical protein
MCSSYALLGWALPGGVRLVTCTVPAVINRRLASVKCQPYPQPAARRPHALQRHQPHDLLVGECAVPPPRAHPQNLRGLQEEVRRARVAKALLPLRKHHPVASAVIQVLERDMEHVLAVGRIGHFSPRYFAVKTPVLTTVLTAVLTTVAVETRFN